MNWSMASGVRHGQRNVWQGNEDKKNYLQTIPLPIIPLRISCGSAFNFCVIANDLLKCFLPRL